MMNRSVMSRQMFKGGGAVAKDVTGDGEYTQKDKLVNLGILTPEGEYVKKAQGGGILPMNEGGGVPASSRQDLVPFYLARELEEEIRKGRGREFVEKNRRDLADIVEMSPTLPMVPMFRKALEVYGGGFIGGIGEDAPGVVRGPFLFPPLVL